MTTQLTLFDRARIGLANLIRPDPVMLAKKRGFHLMWPDYQTGKPAWHLINYQAFAEEGFKANPLIYSAIMYKYRQMSWVPLRAWTGTPENPEPAPENHPLNILLSRPNTAQTQVEMQQLETVYFNIAGNAYLVKVYDKDQETLVKLLPVRPDRMYIIPKSDTREIMGYLYKTEEQGWEDGLAILPEDVLHWKLPNPLDPFDGMGYGMSPIMPAGRSADVENYITGFLKQFFEKGAMPQGMLTFDMEVDEDDAQAVKSRWQDTYGGWAKWSDIMVSGWGAKYQRITPSFDELDFSVLDSRNDSRTLMPFGVPGILLGAEIGDKDMYGTARSQARQQFWEETLLPEIRQFSGEYRTVGMDGAFIDFDLRFVPALQEIMSGRVEQYTALVDRYYPPRQAAEIVGLPAPETQFVDTSFVPMGMLPEGELLTDDPKEVGVENRRAAAQDDGKSVIVVSRNKLVNPLPENRYIVLRLLRVEREMALKEARMVNWGSLKEQWVLHLGADPTNLLRPLIALVNEAQRQGWNIDLVKARIQVMFNMRVPSKQIDGDPMPFQDFDGFIRDKVQKLWNGEITMYEFMDLMTMAVTLAYHQAWAEGMQMAGMDLDEITEMEMLELEGQINNDLMYLPAFASAIITERELSDLQPTDPPAILLNRASIWSNRYNLVVAMALASAGEDQRMLWSIGATEEHCEDCLYANGRVHRASTWDSWGWLPQSQALACKGYHCDCSLVPVDEKALPGHPRRPKHG